MIRYKGFIIKQIKFGVVVYYDGTPMYFPTETEACEYIDGLSDKEK